MNISMPILYAFLNHSVGRVNVERRRRDLYLLMRHRKANEIQRLFRGARGRVYAAIARALKNLRKQQNYSCIVIQKFLRGCIARIHVKETRSEILRRKKELLSVMLVQRIFRGHKGRESLEIERELRRMEGMAAPLLAQLKRYEEAAIVLERLVRVLSGKPMHYELILSLLSLLTYIKYGYIICFF